MTEASLSQTAVPRPSSGLRLGFDRLLIFVLVLAGWEGLSRTLVDPFWISSPSAVATRLVKLAASGDLVWHMVATVRQALLGLVLGMLVGTGAGVLLARAPRLERVLDPFVMGLYSLPRIALAPLFILWFGIGLFSKVMMVFSFVVFIFLLNTLQGLREVDVDLIDMMRAMRATRGFIARRVQMPAMMPWLFAAARISVGLALIGSVLGELLGANRGLGWYVDYAGGRLDTTGVFAGLVALTFVAVVFNQIVLVLERRLVPAR